MSQATTACAECGGPVLQTGRGRPRRFCSDTCKARLHNKRARRAQKPLAQPSTETCAWCGETFVAKRRNRIYCYDTWCRQNAYQSRKANGEPGRVGEFTRACDECGEDFSATYPSARWCSKHCANAHWGRVRSRTRGALPSESYADREIFERDKWRCHLCGKKVRRDAARTDPLGATIDHLMPLSLGGADVPANVATAHYRCNNEKRARAMNEQLALM